MAGESGLSAMNAGGNAINDGRGCDQSARANGAQGVADTRFRPSQAL
jgi:hypothetical protein